MLPVVKIVAFKLAHVALRLWGNENEKYLHKVWKILFGNVGFVKTES